MTISQKMTKEEWTNLPRFETRDKLGEIGEVYRLKKDTKKNEDIEVACIMRVCEPLDTESSVRYNLELVRIED